MEQEVYTVSRLNNEAKQLLERSFSLVHVEGEISNLARPSSGHIYFSLKDNTAQIKCAMFRMHNRHIDFDLDNGTQLIARGRISLYEARGDYQLIVERLEPIGDGLLQRKFEALKKQLTQEGLFSLEHKQEIPDLPKRIGVITSSTGAAVHDILRVLNRRFPAIPVVIYPTQVQGPQAAPQIIEAINTANQRSECDVLILSRGGGSLEDLWPFNEESVARAIFESEIPIVSGVGHEVDVTIADFVADERAATPSAAAELVSPDINEWFDQYEYFQERFLQLIQQKLNQAHSDLVHLRKRLQHPGEKIQQQMQQIDQLEQRIVIAIRHKLTHRKQELSNASRALNAISPLNTLQRGYAIVSHQERIVTDASKVKKGDKIINRLAKGSLTCTVDRVIDQ